MTAGDNRHDAPPAGSPVGRAPCLLSVISAGWLTGGSVAVSAVQVGTTTPKDTTSLNASSTSMSSSTTSSFGTNTTKPVTGFGEVATNAQTTSWFARCCISPAWFDVMNARV